MKVLFVCRAFHNMAGGVERQATLMMNDLVNKGEDVFLLTWDRNNAKSFYELDSRVNWTKMNIGDPDEKASLKTKFKRILFIRKYLKTNNLKLAICFQFGAFFTFKTAIFFSGVKTISAERNSISRLRYTSEGKRAKFMFNFMRFASYITVQFEDYIQKYPQFLRHKIKAINNPIKLDVPFQFNPNSKKIKLIGRLEYQKNFKVFVNALALVKDHIGSWKVEIIGNGKDFYELSSLLKSKKLTPFVQILEPISNLDELYLDTTLICMPSLWEGFPNVAAEAMARGIPVLGFNDCDGVSDLIKSTDGGLLAAGIDDPKSLADQLKKILNEEYDLKALSNNAIREIKKYDEDVILKKWHKLFKDLINE